MPKIYKRKCNYCGRYYEKCNKKFCSRKCSSKGQKRRKGSILKNCPICGKEFKVFFYSLRGNSGKYCSSKCYGKSVKGQRRSIKTEFKKGQISWNKGLKLLQFSGKNHWNWHGGITPIIISIRRCFEYKNWARKIKEKDNWTCESCGKRSGNGKMVCLHSDHWPKTFSEIIEKNHIKTFKEALDCEQLWDINNGRTLCLECHRILTARYQKLNWENQYSKIKVEKIIKNNVI